MVAERKTQREIAEHFGFKDKSYVSVSGASRSSCYSYVSQTGKITYLSEPRTADPPIWKSTQQTVFCRLTGNRHFLYSYEAATHQTINLVLDTIRLAMKKEKKRVAAELQLHSDQGFQGISQAYFKLTQSYGICRQCQAREILMKTPWQKISFLS